MARINRLVFQVGGISDPKVLGDTMRKIAAVAYHLGLGQIPIEVEPFSTPKVMLHGLWLAKGIDEDAISIVSKAIAATIPDMTVVVEL